jgi:hypothetical protein
MAHNAALQTGRGAAPHRPVNLPRRERFDNDDSVLATFRELRICFVPCSPLGRG